MNLFENILNKTKQGFNYVATGQFGSDIFDIQQQAQQKQTNPIQSFLDESKDKPDMQSKRNAVIQMIQNGENDAFIQDTIVNKMGYNPSLTLKERVGSAIGERFTKAGESLNTDKTGFEKSLSATKDIISLPFDIFGATAQPVIQPVMEQAMKIPGVAPTTQYVSEKYGEFRKENPRLAQNIEAIAGIGSVVAPFTKTGQAVAQVPGQLVKQGAEATMQGVRKVAPSVVKGAEATVDVATAPFKSIYNTAKRYVATPEEISGIQAAIKPKQKVKNGVVQRSQKQIENEIKLTNALIRGKGEVPQGLETYALSQKKLLEEMGSEIEKATGQPLFIDATQSAGKIRQLANSKAIQTLDPADTNALLALADRLEQNSGRMSIADAEEMNQYINDVIKSTSTTASEGYKKGLLILVQDLREGLDSSISNIPGEFKNLKKAYGAVRNVYGDTIARQIVFNRQNLSGLVDSIGAIEGFGNIASGAGKIATMNIKEGLVDIGKGMTQNAVGRFIKSKNDPNNIIRSIFRQGGERAKGPDIKPKPLPMLPAPSGKATGAKNFRVNQPKDTSKVITEKVNPEKVKRPGTSGVTPKTVKPVEKTVKPLTEGKQSVTMGDMEKLKAKPQNRKVKISGDMETKKLIETAQQWADKLTFKNGERKYDYYTLVRAYNDVLKNGKESGYYKNADAYIRLEMDKLIKNDKQVGERQVKKEAQKLLPSGEGKSQSANVVNVKPVILPKKQSATMGDMETKKLITPSDKEMELAMNMIKDGQANDKWAESKFGKDIWESYKNSQKKPEIKKTEKPSEQNWAKTAYEESLEQKAKEKAEMYLMDGYEDTLSQMQRGTARRLLKEKMVRTENGIITKQEFLKEKVNQGYKLNTAGTILSKDGGNVGIKINNSYEKGYIEYLKNTRK